MFKEYPDEIFVARKDSPMIIGVEEGETYIASDVPAILRYTRNVYYIGNNEIGRLGAGTAKFYNLDQEEITKELRDKGAEIEETTDVKDALSRSDLVYVTRVQRERFPDEASYEAVKGSYILDNELLSYAKKGITIMHPLPRVDEIAVEVDSYEGAAYFRQAHNGMYLRMALLGLVTGRI